jgi:hypothetical protein
MSDGWGGGYLNDMQLGSFYNCAIAVSAVSTFEVYLKEGLWIPSA